MFDKGFGYCGLVCDYCEDKPNCAGCKQGGCPEKDTCKNYQCCRLKKYDYCFECPDFPCEDSILHKLRIRAFCKYIQLHGEKKLKDRLEINKCNGINYHYPKQHIGDYDKFETEKEIIDFINVGVDFNIQKENNIHKKIIEEWFFSWYDPNWNAFSNVFEENAYYSESWGPEYFGIEEIRQWFIKWHTRSTLEKWEIKNIINHNEYSVVEWYFCCCDKKDRNEFDGVSVIEWSTNNKIVSLKEFASILPKYRP